MFEVLAQTYTTYSGEPNAQAFGLFALFSGFFLFVWLILLVVAVVALWKVFEKAGVEGWKAIIPVYNTYVLAEISGKPGWWGLLISLVGLVAWIPVIGWIASIAVIVLYVLISLELAKKFGKDTTFAVLGLIIFSLVGLLILGFGDAKYEGSVTAKASTPASSATPPKQSTPPKA